MVCMESHFTGGNVERRGFESPGLPVGTWLVANGHRTHRTCHHPEMNVVLLISQFEVQSENRETGQCVCVCVFLCFFLFPLHVGNKLCPIAQARCHRRTASQWRGQGEAMERSNV